MEKRTWLRLFHENRKMENYRNPSCDLYPWVRVTLVVGTGANLHQNCTTGVAASRQAIFPLTLEEAVGSIFHQSPASSTKVVKPYVTHHSNCSCHQRNARRRTGSSTRR